MSNARYLEIDSTYRNRNLWPSPAEFEVPISQSGKKNYLNALDPVSDSSPLLKWTSNEFTIGGGDSITVTARVDQSTSSIGASSDNVLFILEGTSGQLQTLNNYYNNSVINSPSESRRILSYEYLGSDRAQIRIYSPFSTELTDGDSLTIHDPTDVSSLENPIFFVPNGSSGENSYVDHILYNETTNEYRPISNYNSSTKLLQLDTSVHGDIATSWATDKLSIRKKQPIKCINLTNNLITTPSSSTFNFPTTLSITNLENSFLEDSTSGEIKKIIKYVDYRSTALGGTISSINFQLNASDDNGFYNGLFIQTSTGNRLISNYIVTKNINGTIIKKAIVSPNFTSEPVDGQEFTITSGIVSSSFSSNLSTNLVCILPFSYDNLNPFVYTGSLVSQQQMVCYEIELLNLILPNQTLSVGYGSRISFYQYVYIELSNISGAGSGVKNVIYSNNPNSTRMLFRAAIDDVPNPTISSFVKIDGDGAVQTIKFKPNDNLKFSVILSNGEIFDTILEESFSPNEPNSLIQISALFLLRRL